ncbi:MAG: protein kinase, partial [Solirubrobacterales bacterium]
MIGRRLGHYQIVAKLGEGGMGVVYEAIDTLLNRPVALKVISAPASADPQRRRRFLHEAQAASALNHPSIVTIYGIETTASTDGPIDVIAMECVVGRTLDQVIGERVMPLGQILDFAVQIADALATAHAAGIVHRDLKPSNVMVTETGRVKVLDFGLAKLVAAGSGDGTRTDHGGEQPLTSDGAVLGTASYMSPEQAEGRQVDARSDVFAFGALLYEMVTGRRAFRGDSRVSILSAIVREPHEPLRAIRPDAPDELERVVAHCLRKDPARRFQHMDEARVALEDVRDESVSRTKGATRPARAPTLRVTTLALCLLALVVVVGGALAWRKAAAPDAERDRSLTQITRDSGLTTDAAPSPAGNLLAYASDRSGEGNLDIWVQPLPRGEPIRLTRSGADDHEPSFSPDGSRIAFRSERDGGGIYVISALGGHEALIAEKGRRPRFSPDGGSIAYFVGDTPLSSGAVHVVPATGGTPRQLGASGLRARQPIWSPDGKHLLCTAFPIDETATRDWIVIPVDGGSPVATDTGEAFRQAKIAGWRGTGLRGIELTPDAWAPDGETVFFSARSGDSTNVWKVRLSPKTWRVEGAAQQVTFGTGSMEKAALLGLHRLFLTSAVANVDIWGLPTDPITGAAAGELERITREPGNDDWPSISADGQRVAYLSERSGGRAVWVQDLGRPGALATTVSPERVAYPRIAADGS